MWIEEYRGCGCSIEVVTKSELVGYCAKHGGEWSVRIRLAKGKKARVPLTLTRNRKAKEDK